MAFELVSWVDSRWVCTIFEPDPSGRVLGPSSAGKRPNKLPKVTSRFEFPIMTATKTRDARGRDSAVKHRCLEWSGHTPGGLHLHSIECRVTEHRDVAVLWEGIFNL